MDLKSFLAVLSLVFTPSPRGPAHSTPAAAQSRSEGGTDVAELSGFAAAE